MGVASLTSLLIFQGIRTSVRCVLSYRKPDLVSRLLARTRTPVGKRSLSTIHAVSKNKNSVNISPSNNIGLFRATTCWQTTGLISVVHQLLPL